MLLIVYLALLLSFMLFLYFFFFNDTATTEIYTLSLHDALPIDLAAELKDHGARTLLALLLPTWRAVDRKSTRLNSSHVASSYAVFCLTNKKHVETLPVTEQPTQIDELADLAGKSL